MIGYLIVYILVLLALWLTVGFAWFLIIGRKISIEYKKNLIIEQPEFNCMGIRKPRPTSSNMPPMKPPYNPHK